MPAVRTKGPGPRLEKSMLQPMTDRLDHSLVLLVNSPRIPVACKADADRSGAPPAWHGYPVPGVTSRLYTHSSGNRLLINEGETARNLVSSPRTPAAYKADADRSGVPPAWHSYPVPGVTSRLYTHSSGNRLLFDDGGKQPATVPLCPWAPHLDNKTNPARYRISAQSHRETSVRVQLPVSNTLPRTEGFSQISSAHQKEPAWSCLYIHNAPACIQVRASGPCLMPPLWLQLSRRPDPHSRPLPEPGRRIRSLLPATSETEGSLSDAG